MTDRQTTTIAATSPSFVTTANKTAPPHVVAWQTAGCLPNAGGTEIVTATGTGDHNGTLPGTDTRTTLALIGPFRRRRRRPYHHIPRVVRETDIRTEILTETSHEISHAPLRFPNHIVLALPSCHDSPSHVPPPPPPRIIIANTDSRPVDPPLLHSRPCQGTSVQTERAMNPGITTNDRGITTSTGARVHLHQPQTGQVVEVTLATNPHIQVSYNLSDHVSVCDYVIDRGISSRLAITYIPSMHTTTTAFSSTARTAFGAHGRVND